MRYAEPDETFDTAELLRRIGPKRLRITLTILASAAIVACGIFFGIRSLKPAFYVTSADGAIMFINSRTGRIGGCAIESRKVVCYEQDWSSGPLP